MLAFISVDKICAGLFWLLSRVVTFGTKPDVANNRMDYEDIADGYKAILIPMRYELRRLGKHKEECESSLRDAQRLGARLGRKLEVLHKEVKENQAKIVDLEHESTECNRHREDLQAQVTALINLSAEDHRYAHDRVHEFENFIQFVERDLKENGIEPSAILGIVSRIKERQDEQVAMMLKEMNCEDTSR